MNTAVGVARRKFGLEPRLHPEFEVVGNRDRAVDVLEFQHRSEPALREFLELPDEDHPVTIANGAMRLGESRAAVRGRVGWVELRGDVGDMVVAERLRGLATERGVEAVRNDAPEAAALVVRVHFAKARFLPEIVEEAEQAETSGSRFHRVRRGRARRGGRDALSRLESDGELDFDAIALLIVDYGFSSRGDLARERERDFEPLALQGVRARISGSALHEIMVGDMGDLKLRVWLSAETAGPDLLVVRCLQQR